eukprot:TRINITY_DN4138_c0_g1_i5.p1 TRINITY_DN4138_c0_g1~~TRINITY_DN4138_c0_g1_i5.p1  ORF type:complete len:253 (-),score=18.03 TRINITY_DN4138_c0_g1_i5:35-793(-)
MLEHCIRCPALLKAVHACPNPISEDPIANLLNFGSTFLSMGCYISFLAIVTISITRKTTRGFCIFLLLLAQYGITEVFKVGLQGLRPQGACSTSFGRPSSHSAFVGSLAGWLIMEVFFTPANAKFRYWKWYEPLRNIAFLALLLVPSSRVYLNYHTWFQVVEGAALGSMVAVGLFLYIHNFELNQNFQGLLRRFWNETGFDDNLSTSSVLDSQVQELVDNYEMVDKLKRELIIKRDIPVSYTHLTLPTIYSV